MDKINYKGYECQFTPVKSSNLKEVAYINAENALFIKFHNNSVYMYNDVDNNEYIKLMEAESIGSYFMKNLKNKMSKRMDF